MKTNLLTSGIWPRLTAATKKRPGHCMVAVAYFSNGASKLLPVSKGSTLVIDFSKHAVSSGQTKPSEILKLINRGVNVHSVANLHAKVFVIGDLAFVGSTNVSHHSAGGLVEAAIETADRSVVSASRRFVSSLCGELVTPDEAKRMERFYRPPKPPKFGSPGRSVRVRPLHSPVWAVPLVRENWDKEDYAQEKEGLPTARDRLDSRSRFRVEDFCWDGTALSNRLKVRDIVVQVTKEGAGRKLVSPPGKVLHVRRYRKGRTACAIVYLQIARHTRRKNLAAVMQRLGPKARELKTIDSERILRDLAFAHALLNLWSRKG